MTDREVVNQVVELVFGDPTDVFQRATAMIGEDFRKANPSIGDKVFATYSGLMAAKIPAMAQALREARVTMTLEKLSDHELDVWRRLLDKPEIRESFEIFRRATKGVLMMGGNMIHEESKKAHTDTIQRLKGPR